MAKRLLKPTRPNEAKDAPKEWQEAIKARAIQEGVTEDEIVRFGLYYDFKVKEELDKVRDTQKETRDLIKANNELMKDMIKELKKKK